MEFVRISEYTSRQQTKAGEGAESRPSEKKAGDRSPGAREDEFNSSAGSVGTQLSVNLNER